MNGFFGDYAWAFHGFWFALGWTLAGWLVRLVSLGLANVRGRA